MVKAKLRFEIFKSGILVNEVVLFDDVIKIGKDPGNQLVIDDDNISDTHAVIECGEEGFFITDLGGLAGTKVNGQSVGRRALKNQDLVNFGKIDVRVIIADAKPVGQGNGNPILDHPPEAKATMLGVGVSSTPPPPKHGAHCDDEMALTPKTPSSKPPVPPKRISSTPPPPPPKRISSTPPPPSSAIPQIRISSEDAVVVRGILNEYDSFAAFVDKHKEALSKNTALSGRLKVYEGDLTKLRVDLDALLTNKRGLEADLNDAREENTSLRLLTSSFLEKFEALNAQVQALSNPNSVAGGMQSMVDQMNNLRGDVQSLEALISDVSPLPSSVTPEPPSPSLDDDNDLEKDDLFSTSLQMPEDDDLGDAPPPTKARIKVPEPTPVSDIPNSVQKEVIANLRTPLPLVQESDSSLRDWFYRQRFIFMSILVIAFGCLVGATYLHFKNNKRSTVVNNSKSSVQETVVPQDAAAAVENSSEITIPKAVKTELVNTVIEAGRVHDGRPSPIKKEATSSFEKPEDCDKLSADRRIQCILDVSQRTLEKK